MKATPRTRRVAPGRSVRTLARLAREIWGEHYPPIIGRAQVEYMVPRFQSPRAIRGQIASGMEYHLLLHGRAAQGYLAIQGDRGRRSLFLSKLYVRKPARGLGLARAALQLAEATCRRRGLRKLWLTVNKRNAPSIAWYEKMGFAKAGSIVQDIGGGFVMDDYRMTKRIPVGKGGKRGAVPTGRRATRPGRGPRRLGG